MFKFENEYQQILDKVDDIDLKLKDLSVNDFKISKDELIENFVTNQDSEILVKLQNRNDSTNEFLDKIFGKSQSDVSSFSSLASPKFKELYVNESKIEFFNTEHIIESRSENWDSMNDTKSLSLKGDTADIINFFIGLNRMILKDCDENSFAIAIQSKHHVAMITSFKTDDDLILFKEISEEETRIRIEYLKWADFRRYINRGFITHEDYPDLESYLQSKQDYSYDDEGYEYTRNEYIRKFYHLLREKWECNNLF